MSLSQNFRTEVNLQLKSKNQNNSDKFLLIGSCFATEMSLFFKKYCFGYQNPYGTIYNPISLANNFEKLISKDLFNERNLVNNSGVFLSWNHSGKYYSNRSRYFNGEFIIHIISIRCKNIWFSYFPKPFIKI